MELTDILLRLGAALGTGLLLGLEREGHGRAAGLRTLILVCMAAALAGVLSHEFYLASANSSGWRPDPARLGAGLLAGMGFLGAGAIVRQGPLVRGVTTAALLWFTTVIGLCYGSGAFALGLFGTAVAALVLFVLPAFEDYVRNDRYATLIVTVNLDGTDVPHLVRLVEQHAIAVKSIDLLHDATQRTRSLTLHLKFKRQRISDFPVQVVNTLAAAPGVQTVAWS